MGPAQAESPWGTVVPSSGKIPQNLAQDAPSSDVNGPHFPTCEMGILLGPTYLSTRVAVGSDIFNMLRAVSDTE